MTAPVNRHPGGRPAGMPRVGPPNSPSGQAKAADGSVHDELARARAEIETLRATVTRLRRDAGSGRGGCCRDQAATAWAEADVLRADNERQAARIAGLQVALKACTTEIEALRAELAAHRDRLLTPAPTRRLRFRNH